MMHDMSGREAKTTEAQQQQSVAYNDDDSGTQQVDQRPGGSEPESQPTVRSRPWALGEANWTAVYAPSITGTDTCTPTQTQCINDARDTH